MQEAKVSIAIPTGALLNGSLQLLARSGLASLSAEDRADLEDALEDSHHDLLVELGALRQVCGSPKVVQFEDIGTALGC